jgi:hypothetical protein
MDQFPWGVVIILSCGLAFTAYYIYYILRLAHMEVQNEKSSNHSINNQSSH